MSTEESTSVRGSDPTSRFAWIARAFRGASWAPLTVFALHVLVSQGPLPLYRIWPPTDVPMHACGGIAIAYFLRRALVEATRARVLTLGARELALTTFGLTCAAAVAWECAEFVSDRLFLTRAQLSLGDTLGDMVVGIAAGTAWIAATALRHRVRFGPVKA
jgi:hypothetical protein